MTAFQVWFVLLTVGFFLFLMLWAHERSLRTKLQAQPPAPDVPSDYFSLVHEHRKKEHALLTKTQELRGVMLEYATSNATLKLQLTKNNRALYRKNRALKKLRYRPIPEAIFRPVKEGIKKGEDLDKVTDG